MPYYQLKVDIELLFGVDEKQSFQKGEIEDYEFAVELLVR
jgi:hypothetical protein